MKNQSYKVELLEFFLVIAFGIYTLYAVLVVKKEYEQTNVEEPKYIKYEEYQKHR